MRKSRRWIKIGLIVLVCALLLPPLLALTVYLYGQTDRAAPADLIVVLGAGTRPNGAASFSHARRIRHAAALYREGYGPRLLCTGGYTQSFPVSEARACYNLLIELGIPPAAILMEEISRSTEENAIETAKVMAASGLKTALIVSDNYHLLRAEMLFRAQGLAVTSSPAQTSAGPLHWRTALNSTIREVAALGWYAFKTVLQIPVTDVR